MTRFKILLISCMAILGVFAVSAMAAQAAPSWHINNAPFAGNETIESEGGPFELNVPELGTTILCGEEQDEGEIFGGVLDETTVEFFNCEVVGATPPCVVDEPILTEADTELFEKGGVTYDLFESPTGTFTTINISGAECPLAGPGGATESYEVTGNVAGETQAGPETVNQTLTFSPAISAAAGTQLFFEGQPATLTGTSIQRLSGANAGKVWGTH